MRGLNKKEWLDVKLRNIKSIKKDFYYYLFNGTDDLFDDKTKELISEIYIALENLESEIEKIK